MDCGSQLSVITKWIERISTKWRRNDAASHFTRATRKTQTQSTNEISLTSHMTGSDIDRMCHETAFQNDCQACAKLPTDAGSLQQDELGVAYVPEQHKRGWEKIESRLDWWAGDERVLTGAPSNLARSWYTKLSERTTLVKINYQREKLRQSTEWYTTD